MRNNGRVGHHCRKSSQIQKWYSLLQEANLRRKSSFFSPFLCKATTELHPDLSLFQRQGKKNQKDPKWSLAYFLINGIQDSEGRVMHYEWMGFPLVTGNRGPQTPGFSNRGHGGGRDKWHILLHPGVLRKESCKLNLSSPSSYPTERCTRWENLIFKIGWYIH